MRRSLPAAALSAVMMSVVVTPGAAATCDVPTVGPADLPLGPPDRGRQTHVVTGVVAVCDIAARSVEIELPNLGEIGAVKAQLALAGFSRRYGMHQIGFFIGDLQTSLTPTGVRIQYKATIDGLDRYQLAYTLYLSAKP